MNIDKFTITSYDSILGFDRVNGGLELVMDELTDFTLSQAQETTDITGKGGRIISRLKRNKSVTGSGTNGLLSGGTLAAMLGATVTADDNYSIHYTDTATNVTGADAGNAFLNILNNLSFSDNSLQTPMEQLAAIADTYQNLDADSSERSNILSLLGTENDQAAIDALLSNWNLYQTMLSEYATGSGSISEEAALTADSWESSTNRLQNSWVNFIDTLVDQDAIVGTTNALSDLLNGIASITDTVGALPPLIAGVTAILGQDKLFCPIWQ